MKSKWLYTFLLLLISISAISQSKRIVIKSDSLVEKNYLQVDDFYLTHYLYIDLFLRESLLLDVTEVEVIDVLQTIKKYASPDQSITFEIEKPNSNNYQLKIVLFKSKKDGSELLVAFTNWSVERKRFEVDMRREFDCYTRWYFLNNGNKMTYRLDLSKEQDYDKMTKSDLANAYLFDEIVNNDSQVEKLVNEYKSQDNPSLNDQIMADLILLKYYIFKRDRVNIAKQVNQLEHLFNTHEIFEERDVLEATLEDVKMHIELMKKM